MVLAALLPTLAAAAEPADAERTVIVGLGGAIDLELQGPVAHPGGNLMLEFEAIEGWLELEAGVSLLALPGGGREVPIDLLVKKPFALGRGLELMVGLGPELVFLSGRTGGTFAGLEVAADLMFWPTRHFGVWIEPSYEVVFQRPATQGLGCNGGVIFGW